MARKEFTPSVLFFKRMIAATLTVVILGLAALATVNAVRLRRWQSRAEQYEAADAARRAEEEAARARSVVLPEKEKPAGEQNAAEILAANRVIAHAMGSVDDEWGLNCLEGFLRNYEAGVRVFEVDFRQTSDGYVVLRHDWRGLWQEGVDETNIPTLEEFLSLPIEDQYTPLSFGQLLELMEQYPDVCIVTDTKFVEPEAVTEQFTKMVEEAHRMGLSYLFDRMAVQIYSPLHFNVVDNIYHFPHYIYTLYQDNFDMTEDGFRQKANYAQEKGIEAITMWDFLWHEEWGPIAAFRGIKVYVHVVNDREAALKLLDSGVDAVYTDVLVPGDLED